MLQAQSSEWGWIFHSHAGTRPSLTGLGATITPGASNAFGSYTTVVGGGSVTTDVWAIEICVNTGGVSGSNRDMLLTIGIDEAGGTSYTDKISNLYASNTAGSHASMSFYFPLGIKSGTSIGVKASVNNGTAGSVRVYMKLFGQPSRPECVRRGSYVQSIGVVTASSRGTLITPGTTSDGSWVDLGALTLPAWYITAALGNNSMAVTDAALHMDVAIGESGSEKIVLADMVGSINSAENVVAFPESAYIDAAIGDNVFARMQTSGTAIATLSAAAYLVGG